MTSGSQGATAAGPSSQTGTSVARVVITDPNGEERTIVLTNKVTTFGRDESNHVSLRDKKCSRKHFVIEESGDYYDAIDMGSTNKIRIQGRKLARRHLRDGDVISIGDHKVTYRGPFDASKEDELRHAPPTSSGSPPVLGGSETKKGDTIPVPELELPPEPEGLLELPEVFPAELAAEEPVEVAAEPERVITPAPEEPDPVDDSKTCPSCGIDMPENAPCGQCGRKSVKLQAQENYVNTIARQNSILGGIGLWSLRRGKVLEEVIRLPDVEWVLDICCAACGKRHRIMNEFKIKCIRCEHCDSEISLPVFEPPKI